MGATMTPITKSQRLKIQALAAKATPGPWTIKSEWIDKHSGADVVYGATGQRVCQCDEHDGGYGGGQSNVEFIAAARGAVPDYEAALVDYEKAVELNRWEWNRDCALLDEAREENHALAAKLVEAEALAKQRHEMLVELDEDDAKTRAERDDLTARLAAAEARLAVIGLDPHEKYSSLCPTCGALPNDAAALRAKLAAVEAENRELEDKLRVCQEQNDALGDANELAVKLAASEAEIERLETALDYPLHSATRMTAADRIRELQWDNEDAYAKLAAITAARDEACDIAERLYTNGAMPGYHELSERRIAELRNVGKS